MESETRIGQKLRAHCSACNGDRNCEIKGHHPERGEDVHAQINWAVDWFLLTCCGCDHVFVQTVSSNSEEYVSFQDHNGQEIAEHFESIDTWPARSKRKIPDWFEQKFVETDIPDTNALDSSLKELYSALDKDLVVLASIGIRTSFDIASEILGVDAEKTFKQKLDALVCKGHITEADREHIETLVDAGSAAAHRGWKPSLRDLGTLMGVLENFIYGTMVVPARRRAHEADLAKVKKKVPSKKAQKK